MVGCTMEELGGKEVVRLIVLCFFFSSRRRHTRFDCDWSSDVCSSDLSALPVGTPVVGGGADNACGAAGVGVVAPGEAVASWGTSGTLLAPIAEPRVDPDRKSVV